MEQVPLDTFLDGFADAEKRLHAVMRSSDSAATFKPVLEALNWAAAIDDRLAATWRATGSATGKGKDAYWSENYTYGETVKGVRFVRNRVHHAWTDALQLSRTGSLVEVDEAGVGVRVVGPNSGRT